MKYNRTENNNSGNTIPQPVLMKPDIISLDNLPIPETEVANYTADIGKLYTYVPDQEKRFRALEKMIEKKINELQSDKGIGSVVAIGDIKRIREWLNPDKLYLYDKGTNILSIGLQPVDSHAFVGRLCRLFRNTKTWIAPIRTWWHWPGDWKNIIRLNYDLLDPTGIEHIEWKRFQEAMHELIHHAEFENRLHVTNDWDYTAYRERNATFWDRVIWEVYFIRKAEEILMEDDLESDDYFAALDSLFGAFLNFKKWEAGEAVSEIENIRKEKYQTWLPDYAQLNGLLGIKIRSSDILEHYASGECGERLQNAASWIAWRLGFDAYEKKKIQEALRFTRLHGMSENEADHLMQSVKSQLKKKRQAVEKTFEENYHNFKPFKMMGYENNELD